MLLNVSGATSRLPPGNGSFSFSDLYPFVVDEYVIGYIHSEAFRAQRLLSNTKENGFDGCAPGTVEPAVRLSPTRHGYLNSLTCLTRIQYSVTLDTSLRNLCGWPDRV